ncbi:MAG: UPF0058 family protein [Halapricum sp.]
MRKTELVYLHALFDELRDHLADRESIPEGAFASYDRYGVSACAVHHKKDHHREALFRLVDGVVATAPESIDETACSSSESDSLVSS